MSIAAAYPEFAGVAKIAELLGWNDPAICMAQAVADERYKNDPHERFQELGAHIVGRLAQRLTRAGLDEEEAEELAHEFDAVAKPGNRQLVAAVKAGRTKVEDGDHELVEVEVGRALRPGIVELSVSNGHSTALQDYPWQYRERPSAPLRELQHLEPEMVEDVRLALPRVYQEAAAADRLPDLRFVMDREIEGFVAGLPPDLAVPGWHGFALSRDWFAPNLVVARRGIGKSWLVATIIKELAGIGLRTGLIATEGLPEWARRVANYPAERRPLWIAEGTPDVEGIHRLAEQMDGIGLLVIDVIRPLFRRLSVSENDSECIDALIQHLEPLYEPGRALLLVAHSGKDEELGTRGSSAIEDQAGAIFELTPPDEDEEEEGGLPTLAIIHPRKWRAGPLSDQPTLRAFFGKGGNGRLLVEPYEPPDLRARRQHFIVMALEEAGEPLSVGQLNDRIGPLKGGKVKAGELHHLAEQGRVKRETNGKNRHPLWLSV